MCRYDGVLVVSASVLLVCPHLVSYPCTRAIGIHWNTGTSLGSVVTIQVLTGTLLGLHYTPGIHSAYYSIMYIHREVHPGATIRYIHSSGASLVFISVLVHVYRGMFYGSYMYVSSVLWLGVAVYMILMATAFLGYVLPWGQMSYWGATVITNLLACVPSVVP